MIKVVAAFIEKDDKFLIAQRATGMNDVYGKWEFPGGKVEEDETEFEAIEREIKEELEVSVRAKEFMTNYIHKTINKEFDLRLYKCEYVEGKINLNDHLDYKWVTFSEVDNFDLAPADKKLLDKTRGKIDGINQ